MSKKIPEPVTPKQAAEATARIIERRREIDDPYLDEFIAAAHDLRELQNVARKRDRGVPDWVISADADDMQVLHLRNYWDWAEDDLANLRFTEKHGIPRKQVGKRLNLSTGQAVVARMQSWGRKLAAARGEVDPVEMRQHSSVDTTTAQQHWIDQHHSDLNLVCTTLCHYGKDKELGSDEAQASLEEIESDYLKDTYTPATMGWLLLAWSELESSPDVKTLTNNDEAYAPLQEAFAKLEALTPSYHRLRSAQ